MKIGLELQLHQSNTKRHGSELPAVSPVVAVLDLRFEGGSEIQFSLDWLTKNRQQLPRLPPRACSSAS